MTPPSEVLLTVENLEVTYGRGRSSFCAVQGVSFNVRRGETFGIVGESGSGKTTVGKTLVGLVLPSAGRIVFDGHELSSQPPHPSRRSSRRIQMVFQDPDSSLNPRRRIGSTLVESLTIQGIGAASSRADKAMSLLARMGFSPEHFYRYPHEFSGGQLQRIGIIRALIVSPTLIVCDEPVSALDVSIQAQILNLLADVQQDFGLSMIFISHDLSVVRHVAQRVVVMRRGQVVESGETARVFTDPQHDYTRRLVAAVPLPDPSRRAMISRARSTPTEQPSVKGYP